MLCRVPVDGDELFLLQFSLFRVQNMDCECVFACTLTYSKCLCLPFALAKKQTTDLFAFLFLSA